jgi:hypothetical protein
VSDGMYLTLMLGTLLLLIAILAPIMFVARCKHCGARNSLDAVHCRKCDEDMPK